MSKVFYKVLFWVAFAPVFAFMVFAAIAEELAWMLEAVLECLEDKGWPE